MRQWFLTAVIALLPIVAWTQSAPNWPTGYRPSSAELNAAFAGKQDFGGGIFPDATLNNPTITGGTLNGSTLTNTPISGASGAFTTITGDAGATTDTATGSTSPRARADRNAQLINVLDYGGKNDLVSYSDGVWSAGSTAFSSPLGTFNAADVGKPIYLSGAGTNGTTLATTVAAVPSAHALTLGVAPSAPSSNNFAVSAVTVTGQSGAGSYAPGDTLTISGGTASVAPVFTVLKTKLISATINAAGSGGTDSTTTPCVVTLTTGTGRLARLGVTVTAGAVASVDSVWDVGDYSVNPTSLAAEPATGCGLTGATFALAMGVSIPKLTTAGITTVKPTNPVTTTTSGSGTGATLTVAYNPISGTTGTYAVGSNNTAAISAAVARANTLYVAGTRACIYFPSRDSRYPTGAGYLVVSAPTPFAQLNPGCVTGDGPLKSFIRLGSAFTGDLFSWSNAWWKSDFPLLGTAAISVLSNGPIANGISVFGDSASPGQQNAFMLHDWTDNARFDGVECWYVHGYCLGVGGLPLVNGSAASPTRESQFHKIRVISSGSETIPSVTIGNSGSGGDTTNNILFDDLRLLRCAGKCLVISPGTSTGVGGVRFHSVNTERSNDGDDLMVWGDPGVQNIMTTTIMTESDFFQSAIDHAQLRLTGLNSNQVYGLDIQANFGSGSGYGLVIDTGRALRVTTDNNAVAQAVFTINAPPAVGLPLIFNVLGLAGDTFKIDPGSMRSIYTNFRTPDAPGSLGVSAVNLQQSQSTIGNTALGDHSVTIGDGSNKTTVAATNSIAIGRGNVSNGTGTIMVGVNNVNTGLAGVVHGTAACDGSRNRTWAWAEGNLVTACDIQVGMDVLRGLTTDATPIVLTTNASAGGSTPGATTIANPTANHVFFGPVYCTARTANGDHASWSDPGMDLSKVATNPTTAVNTATFARRFASAGAAAWTLVAAADTTNGGLALTATGELAKTIDWGCLFGPRIELQ